MTKILKSKREEKILKCCKEYFNEHGNLALSTKYIHQSGEEKFVLGYELRNIKSFLKGNKAYGYSDGLIEALKEIDPRVFEPLYILNFKKEVRDEKILKLCKEYHKVYGNLAMHQDFEIFDEETQMNYPLGKTIVEIRTFVNGSGGKTYTQHLIDEMEKLDANIFKKLYSKEVERNAREKKLLEYFKKFYAENGNLAIPYDYEISLKNEKPCKLGSKLNTIKTFLRGRKHTAIFSKEFLEQLRELDPHVFDNNYTLALVRNEIEEKIIKAAKRYCTQNGNLAVPNDYIFDLDGEEIKLGAYFNRIKNFRNEKGERTFSEELCVALEKIDPNVFMPYYTKELLRHDREKLLLKACKAYSKEHGNLAFECDYVFFDDETGEKIDVGKEFEYIKKFLKGKGTYSFHEEFIDNVKEIDPRVFEENYTKNLAREKRQNKLLNFCREYYNNYGNLAVHSDYIHIDFETGEKVDLCDELAKVKRFLKGTGTYVFDESFINDMKAIDSRVFEPRYSQKLKNEMKQKREFDRK